MLAILTDRSLPLAERVQLAMLDWSMEVTMGERVSDGE